MEALKSDEPVVTVVTEWEGELNLGNMARKAIRGCGYWMNAK